MFHWCFQAPKSTVFICLSFFVTNRRLVLMGSQPALPTRPDSPPTTSSPDTGWRWRSVSALCSPNSPDLFCESVAETEMWMMEKRPRNRGINTKIELYIHSFIILTCFSATRACPLAQTVWLFIFKCQLLSTGAWHSFQVWCSVFILNKCLVGGVLFLRV